MKKKNLKNNTKTTKEKTCPSEAAFRYTWAGKDESYACHFHSLQLEILAGAIGYRVQLIPIEPKQGISCRQIVS